jgi:hypothetical protein
MTNLQKAINLFNNQVVEITGRDARQKEIESFVDQYETALAHRQYLVQYSFCDFQTLSGKAETVSINLVTVDL